MFRRIAICMVVTVSVSTVLFLAAIAWIETREGAPAAGNDTNGIEDVAAAYRIDREGRKLAELGRPAEDLRKAEEKYRKSLAMFKKLGHRQGESEVLNDLGILYFDQREYDQAVEHHERSLEIKRKIGWSWGEGNTLANLGNLYGRQQQYAKEAEYYEQAVNAYEKAGDWNKASAIVSDLAETYFLLRQSSKAIKCLEKWVETAGQRKDPRIEADALVHLGTYLISHSHFVESHFDKSDPTEHFDESEFDKRCEQMEAKAIGYLEKSVELAKQHKFPKIEAEASYHLGECYSTRGMFANRPVIVYPPPAKEAPNQDIGPAARRDYSTAARYFERSAEAAKRARNLELQQNALRALGSACEHLGQNSEAIAAYEAAREIAVKQKDSRAQAEFARQLATLYYNEQNYSKVAEHCMYALESKENFNGPTQGGEPDLKETLGKAYRALVKLDPANEQLKRVKLFLDQAGDNEALAQELSRALAELEEQETKKVKNSPFEAGNVNVCDKYGRLPLEAAAEKGDLELIKQLVDSDADLKMKNRSGVPVLDAAFTAAMLRSDEARDSEIAEYLLNLGANVNTAGLKNRPALQWDGRLGDPDFFKLLIDKGADVNGRDANGQTALMFAANWGNGDAARLLLEKGADLQAKNDKGETAIMMVGGDSRLFREDSAKDQLEVVKLLLEKGAGVNDRDACMGGRTALMRYAARGFQQGAKLLLEKGADVNAVLDDGSNALFGAIVGDRAMDASCSLQSLEYWTWRRHPSGLDRNVVPDGPHFEAARLLIKHGINVNARLKTDGSTALAWAAYLENAKLVRLLLDNGANVDSQLSDGRTPLMCAVTRSFWFETPEPPRHEKGSKPEMSFERRQIEVAKLLLERKADVNAKRPDGTTALTWAMILGEADMVEFLLERGANPKFAITDGSTPAEWLARRKRSDVRKLFDEHWSGGTLATVARSGLRNEVKRLLDEGADVNAKDSSGATALIESAREGDMEMVRLLLEKGADVRTKDDRGWTALNEALRHDRLDIATLLLDRGADPNSIDSCGWTPLIQAASSGQREAVNLLLARGADIRTKDAYGRTAFMRAVEMGHRKIAALLLDKGADVNAAEADGWTPAMAAATWQDREMVRLLRERGARMTVAAAALLGDLREVQRLVDEAVKTHTHIPDGSMALLFAARNGREDMVKLLLERCPDINIKEVCCDAALLVSIDDRHTGIAKALLERGANANAVDDKERTALYCAVKARDFGLVCLLLEKGADVNAQSPGHGAPLMGAIANGDVEIVRALLEKGARVGGKVSSSDVQAAGKSSSKEILELLKGYAVKQTNQPQPSSREDH